MARIPVRFQRVAAAFDEVARVRLCESSGSEHSPESFTDLSDLVNSFIERGDRGGGGLGDDEEVEIDEEFKKNDESDAYWSDSEKIDKLKSLFGGGDDDDDVKGKIFAEAELACDLAGDASSPGFKRRLMTHLREKGFDAGLCKSKWEKTKKFPAGDYEYIDINVEGSRYIVEAFLVGEFDIARPTHQYTSLLEVFPTIFVGKVNELKQIVKLMCTAIRESLKCREMERPPWRRNAYMQAKWFGSYKRTTKAVNTPKPEEGIEAKRSVGFKFEKLPIMPCFCRQDDFSSKVGLRIGYLTAAFNG
ncbi:hypothetical protein UlMin_018023 [Ulmus minor]